MVKKCISTQWIKTARGEKKLQNTQCAIKLMTVVRMFGYKHKMTTQAHDVEKSLELKWSRKSSKNNSSALPQLLHMIEVLIKSRANWKAIP